MKKDIKKASGILSSVFLGLTLMIEIIRQIVPIHTVMPTATEEIISVIGNITFALFFLSFTVFLFITFKNRSGKMKAVFYTLYSDCIIGFLVGSIIMTLAGSQDSASFGITPLESIYYYFVGLSVMVISVALTLAGMIVYPILKGLTAKKIKKHQQSS